MQEVFPVFYGYRDERDYRRNEVWEFRLNDKGWYPHHIVKYFVEGEVIEEERLAIS